MWNKMISSSQLAVNLLLAVVSFLAVASQQQQSGGSPAPTSEQVQRQPTLAAPERRPSARVNIREWTKRISEDIRLVSNRSSCTHKIAQFYEREGQFQRLDAAKLRDSILAQINSLLGQHKQALNAIVAEAEQAAAQHKFQKELRINYTDVHRLRNELESEQAQIEAEQAAAASNALAVLASGPALGLSSSQSTSISGGTPVAGPAEWQTPLRQLVLQVNKNFGEIPVNTSMSAIHLPLPIYPGTPEIMNGIAWTERLDGVFRKNLEQFAHVHHQYYGDHLGFMRTFPAHKWRIPRTDPDLFDARTRPWYIAGAATPKDVVVLVDTSGSMTGLRREIAKGVVFELLDTLTIQDHFAVLRFSETVTPVGLPRCSGLRQPRLVPQLEAECAAYYHQHHSSPMAGGDLPAALASSSSSSECAHFRRQWETRGQYLRDHPNVVLDKNGSYLTDDAYKRSLANVTSDIRGAYLLPATSRNIRYLKSNFSMPTAGIANFTHALMAAFELLQAYNRSNELGSQCQQAIMLITDGAIRAHEEVFNRYNYPNSPVRLFSYMIGREVGNIGPTKEMACRNRGYYAHVINLSEIREQVQKYLAVMARPLVLAQQHPVSWTNAYGDETYQVLTDWALEMKRRERARIMLNEERERLYESNSSDVINIELTNIAEYDELPLVDEQLKNRIICEDAQLDDPKALEQSLDDELDPLGYNDLACHWTGRRADLLTSVVKPVFDLKNTSLFFERILSKNVWTERETRVRNAQLLGVAAVDLRIGDILRAAPSHLLGPNGYAILVGQNGFVMHHPDHRALLEDPFDKQSKILKPYFNALDLTHIEQVYHRNESEFARKRQDDTKLIKLREAAIRRASGSESIPVKRAIDCRRRPHVRQQLFVYGPLRETPFALMLALPKAYGLQRLQAKLALSKATEKHFSPSEYDLLTVHPEYRYCERVNAQTAHQQASHNESLRTLFDLLSLAGQDEASAEQALELADLTAISEQSAGNKRLQQQQAKKQSSASIKFVCDKELFPSLLFDARATHEPPGGSALCCMSPLQTAYFNTRRGDEQSGSCNSHPDEFRATLAKSYGLEMSFLATRSGLTRARVFELSARVKKLAALFIERHNKALDEPWYARTVDWSLRSTETLGSTMITVPFNAYIRLIAKLRQRITQRHPAANDTRSNCDPTLDEQTDADTDLVGGQPGAQETSTLAAADTTGALADTSASLQNDAPLQADTTGGGAPLAAGGQPAELERVNYAEYSSFDFLDLLANSSVHVSATQAIVATGGAEQRAPVGVTGHLYDYASFARRFLNSTSLVVSVDEQQSTGGGEPTLVQLCPNGECATRCGLRSDTIDCLLVDNNGYIVVGEELAHVGRSLLDYDDKLMAALVEQRVYQPVVLADFQAICARNDQAEQAARQTAALLQAQQQAAAASASAATFASSAAAPSSLWATTVGALQPGGLSARLVANFARALVYTTGTLYSALFLRSAIGPDELLKSQEPSSLLGQLYQWQRSAIMAAEAQSAIANQSLLALLPNKTYLRPCEKQVTLYEMRAQQAGERSREPNAQEAPIYYETKCGCSGWFVFDQVPETNLLMLIVNTSTPCRRCETQPMLVPSALAPIVAPLIDTSLTPVGSGGGGALPTGAPVARTPAEEQVCAMLERDAQLYVARPTACLSSHPDEAQILLCGSAGQLQLNWALCATLATVGALSLLWCAGSKKS